MVRPTDRRTCEFTRHDLSHLVGDQGKGRSFIMIDIAARLTCGEIVSPGGRLDDGPGGVRFRRANDDNGA